MSFNSNTILTRVCRYCGKEKNLATDFGLVKKGSVKRRIYCRACAKSLSAAYYVANRDAIKKRVSLWQKDAFYCRQEIQRRYYLKKKNRQNTIQENV